MTQLNDLFVNTITSALTSKDIEEKTSHFRLGDVVEISDGTKAKIVQICTHHIIFELPTGMRTSVSRFDCINFPVIVKSGFDSCNSQTTVDDVVTAVEGKDIGRK